MYIQNMLYDLYLLDILLFCLFIFMTSVNVYVTTKKKRHCNLFRYERFNCKMNTVSNFYVMNIPGSIMF